MAENLLSQPGMMTMRRLLPAFSIVAGALLCFSVSAANALTFDFNSLASGASNTSVRNYMNGVITGAGIAGSVSVSGARGEKYYNGDNHVVGQSGTSLSTSETLGTSDGGVHHGSGKDTFITNVGGTSVGNDRVTMTFSFKVYSVSFDFEVFPDASCRDPSHCGTNMANAPDLTFYADNTLVKEWLGVEPGQPGGSDNTHSPSTSHEHAPQLIGVSGTFSFAGGVTTLSFVDWPQKIGIDNLVIDTRPPTPPSTNPVPEPSTLLLLASGLAGLGRLRRKRNS